MTKMNFSAWHVDNNDFNETISDIEKLKFFARYGVLAPSGHNTQPWVVSFKKDHMLVGSDPARSLPYSGVQANEPLVSIGAFVGTVNAAATALGYELSIEYLDPKKPKIKLSVNRKTATQGTSLSAITSRVSNRNNYDDREIPKEILKQISSVGSHGDTFVKLLVDKVDIKYIAEKTAKATLTIMGDKKFRIELSKWVRSNLTNKKDGMPGYVQGIPTPPSLLASKVIKYFNISKDQAKKDEERIQNSSALVILGVKNETNSALIDAGRRYARICIEASSNNIASAGSGASIIEPEVRTEIANKYRLPGKPVAIIRLGYTDKKAKHAPRMPLEDVVKSF